ncbi:polysaccharide deacetylase family protein [uncultured Xylophilus sp.]|uniref:polysaccharide deacetylase family protein n=1 Tax=uncultured Xylophilus sp. TaxID=296832 RepID=UPI0025E948FF|nr:polysaccharide deacetylase family protein [uncultured Xylophilus sp.]
MGDALSLRAGRWLSRHWVRRPLRLQGHGPMVSFTFDDAPLSACEAGAEVLEQLGVRGTYYVAGGLTDRPELGRPCHSVAALRQLLASGHQLGCHGFSHVRCDTLGAAALREELDRNAAFLADLGVDTTQLDFAYPFGAYGWGARDICAQRFRSMRITGGGAQCGTADRDALRSHRLYRSAPDGVSYADRLAATVRGHGWLVVNTHEVESDPGPYGCTPKMLHGAVAAAIDAGCQVLPVGAALDVWLSGGDSASP